MNSKWNELSVGCLHRLGPCLAQMPLLLSAKSFSSRGTSVDRVRPLKIKKRSRNMYSNYFKLFQIIIWRYCLAYKTTLEIHKISSSQKVRRNWHCTCCNKHQVLQQISGLHSASIKGQILSMTEDKA